MSRPIVKAEHNYSQHPDLNLFHMHTHEVYEIYCFLSGTAKYFVEGTVYPLKPNDILILKKAEAHSLLISGDAPYERMFVYFNRDALLGAHADDLIQTLDARPLGYHNRYSASRFAGRRWREYIERICETDDMEIRRLYLSVLVTELAEAEPLTDDKHHTSDTVGDIISYINRHLTEDLSLDRLCDKFYISKSHLNRRFKQLTGSTVWEYIKSKRLVAAKELLQNGTHPTAAAAQCGFHEYSAFFYAYKTRFGISPKQDFVKTSL